MKRELKAAAGAGALLVGAATVVVVGGATTGTAAGTPSSAYGITASLAGTQLVAPTPYVVSTDGSLKSASTINVPIPGLADVTVNGVTAENNHATSDVAPITISGDALTSGSLKPVGDALAPVLDGVQTVCDQLASATTVLLDPVSQGVTDLVNQLGVGLAPLLEPDNGGVLTNAELLDNLTPTCDALDNLGTLITVGAVTAECTGTTGTSHVGNINLLGLPVVLPLGTNQALADGALGALAPIVDIRLNTQTTNADGTFSVTALELDLLGAAGAPVVSLEIGSVTCGNVTNDTPTTAVPTATKPAVIKTKGPKVTG